MKKLFTLFIIVGLGCSLNAQITYTAADGPRVGLKIESKILKDISGIDLNKLAEAGGNKTWDVRGDSEDNGVTSFVGVDHLAFKSSFPGTNMALVDVPNPTDSYLMLERNSTGFYLLGSRDDTTNIVFSPKYLQIPFPLNFGQNYQNNVNASYNIDTIPVKINIQSNANVDAWGMMTTNEGTYPVLKVKSIQITEITYDGIPFGSTSFSHFWVTSGYGNPIVNFDINEVESPFGLLTDTTITYVHRQEVVSTKDIKESKNKLSISPNPVIDHVTIQAHGLNYKSAEYAIINAEGKLIKDGKLKDNEALHLNLQDLISGNYLVQLILDKQTMLFDILSKK